MAQRNGAPAERSPGGAEWSDKRARGGVALREKGNRKKRGQVVRACLLGKTPLFFLLPFSLRAAYPLNAEHKTGMKGTERAGRLMFLI